MRWLFLPGGLPLEGAVLALVVPLLSLPQLTHCLLDGFIWRTREDPNLIRRLGWDRVRGAPYLDTVGPP